MVILDVILNTCIFTAIGLAPLLYNYYVVKKKSEKVEKDVEVDFSPRVEMPENGVIISLVHKENVRADASSENSNEYNSFHQPYYCIFFVDKSLMSSPEKMAEFFTSISRFIEETYSKMNGYGK